MKANCVAKSAQRLSADVVVIPVWEGIKKGMCASEGAECGDLLRFPLESGDFVGRQGETLLLYTSKGKEKRVLLIGLGKEKECTPESLRCAFANAIKSLHHKKLQTANVFLHAVEHMSLEVLCKAVFEGVLLADYSF